MPARTGRPLMREADPYARLAGVYDEMVVDPCHGRWAAFLHEIWRADEDGVRTVLDVCCGTGLMASALAALGHRVVGVDASPQMLARARLRLGPGAELIEATLPELGTEAVFDAAVSTFDGLNYLTPAGLRATLEALSGRIRPGGWLVFDVHTDAMMQFTAANPVVAGESHGRRFVITSAVDAGGRTCDSRIEITRDDGDGFSEHHHQHFFSDGQLRDALADAGFERVTVTDEYTHDPVDEESLRATWIARRPSRHSNPAAIAT